LLFRPDTYIDYGLGEIGLSVPGGENYEIFASEFEPENRFAPLNLSHLQKSSVDFSTTQCGYLTVESADGESQHARSLDWHELFGMSPDRVDVEFVRDDGGPPGDGGLSMAGPKLVSGLSSEFGTFPHQTGFGKHIQSLPLDNTILRSAAGFAVTQVTAGSMLDMTTPTIEYPSRAETELQPNHATNERISESTYTISRSLSISE